MKKNIKYLILLVVIALGATLFYNKVYIPKSTFETQNPTMGALKITVRGIGNLSAKDIYSITAQTGGKIQNIYVNEGDWVEKGELLVSVDPVDLPLLLAESQLGLKKASYELEASKNSLESLMAQKELLQTTYNRYEKLIQQEFASQAEYDKAKSDLQSIDAQIEVSKFQIKSAKAELLRLGKSKEALQTKLQRFKVYSPVDGYVISKQMQKSQTVLPTTTILKIVDPNTLWVNTYIDERISNKIDLMQNASISLRSQPNSPYQGVVKRIVPTSDAITLQREINIGFKNIPKPFYINEQAEVKIEIQNFENILKIPLQFLDTKDGKKGVWIAKDNTAHFQEISIIAQNDEEAAIASGIDTKTKMLVITSKKKPLREGMKIYQ